jgi:two-component system, sensor histidine kinase and response regulator
MKKLFILLSLFVATTHLLLAAPNDKKVSLQLMWKHQFQFAGYYAAKEKGFYQEAGLDVQIKEFEYGMNISQDILSQKVDFGVGRSSLILEILNNQELFLLASIYQHSPFILLAKQRSDLENVSQLKNKRIMTTDDVVGMASLTAMLIANGVSRENFIKQKHSFNVDDLIADKTDAIAAYISNEPFQMDKKGVPYTIFSPKNHGFDFYSDILYTANELYLKNPELVDKFYQASIKGWDWAFANIEETVDLILKNYNTQNKSKPALIFEAQQLKKLAFESNVQFGSINNDRIRQIAQIYRLLGMAKSNKKLDNFIYQPRYVSDIDFTDAEKRFLFNNPTIRVHNEQDWAPYNFFENDKARGFSIDYIKLLAQKTGLKLEFISGPKWDEFLGMIKAKKLDVMLNIAKSPERHIFLNFSKSYVALAQALFIRDDINRIHSIEELFGKRFAIPKGFFFEEKLKSYPEIELVTVKGTAESIQAVAFDRADALLDLIPVVNYYKRKLAIDNVVLGGTLGLNEGEAISLHVGVRKDWPELVSIFNKAIGKTTDEELINIHNKWINTSYSNEYTATTILTAKEKKWLQDNPITRIATLKSWPPYDIFLEDGSHTGLHKELLDLINETIGSNFQPIIFETWSEAYEKAASGKISGIIGLSWTQDRTKTFNFSPAYHYKPAEIVLSAKNKSINKWLDLDGKTFWIRKNASLKTKIQADLPQAKILEADSEQEALTAIAAGKGDAYMAWISSSSEELAQKGLKIGLHVDTRQGEFSIGSHNSNPIVAGIIKKGINAIPLTRLSALRQKWLKKPDQKQAVVNINLTQEEMNFLKAHPVIKVHNEKDWPPFDYFEFSEPKGFSIDYIKLLTSMLGIKIDWETGTSWNEALSLVQQKEIDVVLNIVNTKKRENYLLFTPPYIRNPNVIVSKKEFPYRSLKELTNKTVAIGKGYYQEEFLIKTFPSIKLLKVEDSLAGLKAVSFGNADATLGEKAVLDYMINRNLLTELKTSGEINIGNSDLPNLRIGIRNDWPLLQSALTKAMAQVTPQQMNQIRQKWIIPTETYQKRPSAIEPIVSNSYLISMTGVAIAIGFILILISWLVSRSKNRDISELYNSKELRRAGVAIIVLSIVIIILTASYQLVRFKEGIQNEVQNRLQTVLNASQNTLKIWIEEKKRALKMITGNSDLSIIVKNLLFVSQQEKSIIRSPAIRQLRTFINTNSNIFNDAKVYVVSKNMTIIGAQNDLDIGKQVTLKEHRDFLRDNIFLGKFIMIPPVPSNFFSNNKQDTKEKPSLFFAGPITNEHGELMAALILELDPLKEFTQIARSGRLGKTGETYIFDHKGFLLTESRFNKELQEIGLISPLQNSTLNIRISDPGIHLTKNNIKQVNFKNLDLTLMAKNAISGNKGSNISGYRDYRGITVVGAWHWDRLLNIGLASEMDWYEAFDQYTTMRNTLIITLAITIFIALSLTGFTLWIGQSATRSLARSRDQLEIRVRKRTADLERIEKRFRDLLESAPDSMIIVDEKGIISIINAQTEKLFGYHRDELIGKEIEMVIPQRFRVDHPDKRNQFTKQAMSQPIEAKLELQGLRKNGTEFPVEVSLSPLKTDEGLLISAAVRDITERVLAEAALKESEERNRLVLENVGEGIFGVDLNGKITFINTEGCTLLGYDKKELFGEKIHDIIHHTRKNGSNYPVEECPMKKAYTEGKTFTINDEILWKKDGTAIDVVYTSAPIIKENNIEGAVITFRDVTEKRIAQGELKATQERFKAYFENSQVGMMITHPDKGLLEINKHLSEMLGYSFDQLKQTDWAKMTHPEDVEEDIQNFQKVLSGQTNSYTMDKRMLRKDGNIVHVNLSVSCVRNPDGTVDKFLASLLDITEQKMAEEKLRKNEEVLSRSQALAKIGGWEYDIQSKEIFWSNEVYRIHEMDINENKDWITESINCYQEEDRKKIANAFSLAVDKGEPYDLALKFKTVKGRNRWVRSTGEPVYENGKLVRVAGNVADITRQKKIEAQLISSREEAEAATKAKSDFLANMSHEIRTPMNAIMGMTHLALQTELTNKQQDYLTKVHTAATSLLGLINDILDFSKIEAGKLDMESTDFNLDQVFNNVSTLIALKAQEKGLEFLIQCAPDIPRNLIGDPLRLGQILINLSNNAVKFTETGEIVIQTKIVSDNPENLCLQFSVQDTGIGLTKEQIGKLFQSFSQADASTTRKFGGTGLGLTISKRLVEMMNGQICVESVPGEGSSFIFTAEFRKQALREESPGFLAKDLKGLKVLVTDDNETSRQIFEEILISFGFEVELAFTGGKAIDAITTTKKPFDLIIMDWKMPGMSGIETSIQIKNQLNLPVVPKIIMCTSYGREEIMNKANEAGLEGFLVKPVNPSILLDTILHVFGKSESNRVFSNITEEMEVEGLKQIQGANLLLVEDNEINQQVAQEILQNAGLIVELAENGQIAIDKVNSKSFDLVLMDIQMPVMDGYTATKMIRKDQKFQNLPIIAMTANAMVGDRDEAIKSGMNDHVAKPIDPQHLFATLVKWIEPGEREIPKGNRQKAIGNREEIDFPDSLPGIDIKTGLNRVGGNKKLYRDLLVKYSKDNQTVTQQIQEALNKKDMELAQRLAHTVKGVSGNIGAGEVQKTAEVVELSIKSQKLDQISEEINTLNEKIKVSLSGLESLIEAVNQQSNVENSKAKGNTDDLKALLNKLEPHLKKRKPKPCKEVMEKVTEYEWAEQYNGLVNDLNKLISKYKFKDAQKIFEDLLSLIV